MKFTFGQWAVKKNFRINAGAEINDYELDEKGLTVYAPFKNINHRGDTLNTGMLTVKYTSPSKNVIGVHISHFKGIAKKSPAFTINSQPGQHFDVIDSENELVFQSGDLKAVINKKRFDTKYFYDGRFLSASNFRSAAYILDPGDNPFMREQLSLSVGENVYGLGERFMPFIKNGQSIELWNEDGGTATEISYKNIPFYMTSNGYGVFVNHPENISYEVASEHVERVQFSVPGEELAYFMIGGETLKDVMSNYTLMTGRPPLPPAWSFGLWLSTSFTTNYDEETVTSFIDGMAEREIPLSVFHFDCFWMKEFQWCDFVWDKRVFSDVAPMLARLKAKGLRICVWINSYIAQKSILFDEGVKNGYLIKKADGSVWQTDLWQAGMGIVDFTNPAACDWYKSKLAELMDMGVDCFKTDFGERIPTDVVYYDGSDPMKMHNYYPFLYNKAVYELIAEKRGKDDAVVFARSATAGCQQFPVHWGGDCFATYESMQESLRGGLSFAMSGFGFWSHDIGGFEATATADVYKRWAAFGLLSTHSRLHGSTSYRVPWMYDGAVPVVKFFTNLKCKLMPYLYAQAYKTSQTGVTMLRAMVLEYQNDPVCKFIDTQYMLGDALLVAPVFREDGICEYYLPSDRDISDGNSQSSKWRNLIDGRIANGGKYYKEHFDYMSLPLWQRSNTLLITGAVNDTVEYDYEENCEVHMVDICDGMNISTNIVLSDGTIKTVSAARSGASITIRSDFTKPWKFIWHGLTNFNCSLKYSKIKDDIIFIPNYGCQEFTINLI